MLRAQFGSQHEPDGLREAGGVDPNETGHLLVIQERAYTSPIWYRL
jgi:hypothetical protein